MPHFLSSMAEYYRESAKTSAKGRKTMAARKGSPRHSHRTGASQFNSSGRTSVSAGGEMNRQEISLQAPSMNWPADSESDLHFVTSYRGQAELDDDYSGRSPPRIDTVRPPTGFQLAPAPASLPRPPSSWTVADEEETTIVCSDIPDQNVGSILSNQLKMLLKVQG